MQWFLLLDMSHCAPVWPPDTRQAQVSFLRRVTLQEVPLPTSYRISPVFPLLDSTDLSIPRSFNLDFYFLADPFSEIGRLTAKLRDEELRRFWISLGAA